MVNVLKWLIQLITRPARRNKLFFSPLMEADVDTRAVVIR